jgi:hypothetical protein
MKQARWLCGIAVFLSFFVVSVASAADFSGDITSISKDGTFKGKVFATKHKVRMEDAQSVIITRLDKNLAWMLTPKNKIYIEQPIDFRNAIAASERIDGEVERTLIGPEKIGGRSTSKYKIVYGKKREIMLQWIDDSLKIPVKAAAEDNSWSVEYSNIKVGPQADTLFEIPADYSKLPDKNSPASKVAAVEKAVPVNKVAPAEKMFPASKNPFAKKIFPVNKVTPAEKIPQDTQGNDEDLEY